MVRSRKKGKILKIRQGYNPNCSSGMWALYLLIIGFMLIIIYPLISAYYSATLYMDHKTRQGGKKNGNYPVIGINGQNSDKESKESLMEQEE